MLRTYKATIKNNHIEWDNDTNEVINSDSAVPVFITILDEPLPDDKKNRGKGMVSALNEVVKLKAFSEVGDPVEFIREMRQDRPFPGREDADR
ncbi:MAG: hypothetical protein GX268_05270 [Methanomicrobiales archaeon]|nr:hypothetical protein [Methanomicrobiales archaeon]